MSATTDPKTDTATRPEEEQVSEVKAGKARASEPEEKEPIKVYDEETNNEEEDGDFVRMR